MIGILSDYLDFKAVSRYYSTNKLRFDIHTTLNPTTVAQFSSPHNYSVLFNHFNTLLFEPLNAYTHTDLGHIPPLKSPHLHRLHFILTTKRSKLCRRCRRWRSRLIIRRTQILFFLLLLLLSGRKRWWRWWW